MPAIPPGHGYALDGTPAGCRLFAPSTLVDCVACLHDSWQEFLPTLDEEQGRAAHWIVDVVNQNGPSGVSKSALLASRFFWFFDPANVPPGTVAIPTRVPYRGCEQDVVLA